jgi:DNA invertase Pin-like site-specific DNA recombinase
MDYPSYLSSYSQPRRFAEIGCMTKNSKLPPAGPRFVGYARVSTDDQNLDMQIRALVNAGVLPENIHSEHVSAVANRRPRLEMALRDARDGDTLLVWKLDRLARSLEDLLSIMKRLDDAGVAFKSLTEGIDTSTSIGKLLLHVLGAIAQFERDLTVERTKAGVRAHRERGGKIGQPAKIVGKLYERGERMFKAGKSVAEVAAALKTTTTTVYSTFKTENIQAWRAEAAKAKK